MNRRRQGAEEKRSKPRTGCWVTTKGVSWTLGKESHLTELLRIPYLLWETDGDYEDDLLLFTDWPDRAGATIAGSPAKYTLTVVAEPLRHVEAMIQLGYFKPFARKLIADLPPF